MTLGSAPRRRSRHPAEEQLLIVFALVERRARVKLSRPVELTGPHALVKVAEAVVRERDARAESSDLPHRRHVVRRRVSRRAEALLASKGCLAATIGHAKGRACIQGRCGEIQGGQERRRQAADRAQAGQGTSGQDGSFDAD